MLLAVCLPAVAACGQSPHAGAVGRGTGGQSATATGGSGVGGAAAPFVQPFMVGGTASTMGEPGSGAGGQLSGAQSTGGTPPATGGIPASSGESAVEPTAATSPVSPIAGAGIEPSPVGGSGTMEPDGEGSSGAPSAGAVSAEAGAAPIAGSGSQSESEQDAFGVKKLYPSALSRGVWTAEHWGGAGSYDITDRLDVNDPAQLSGMRGSGSLSVSSDGVLTMGGGQPRIYVYPGTAGPWRDVEVTVYYQRVADDGTAWGGLVIGTRSGPEGHGETPCDAHTYYSRLRHDGATDFEKELMHSPSSTQSRVEPEVVWPEGTLPYNRWIGWKFVIYNLSDGSGVKLEAYRDLSDGANGGSWELMNETVDDGGWFTQTNCEEHEPVNGMSDLISMNGGATFIRNTGVTEAHYRWFSVREIEPVAEAL